MILIVFLFLVFGLLVFFSGRFLSQAFLNFFLLFCFCFVYVFFGLGDLTDHFWILAIVAAPSLWVICSASLAALSCVPFFRRYFEKFLRSWPISVKTFFAMASGCVLLMAIFAHLLFYWPVYFNGLRIHSESPGASGSYYQIDLSVKQDGEDFTGPILGLTNPRLKIKRSKELPGAYELYFISYKKVRALIRFTPDAESDAYFEVIKAEPGSILNL